MVLPPFFGFRTEIKAFRRVKIKIRNCFFSAYQSKKVNCEPALAAAQPVEGPIKRKQ
jgi:hypothetical protein